MKPNDAREPRRIETNPLAATMLRADRRALVYSQKMVRALKTPPQIANTHERTKPSGMRRPLAPGFTVNYTIANTATDRKSP